MSDGAGNKNDKTAASANITVDTTAPTITITQPSTSWATSKTVKATVSDTNSVTMFYST